jgi:hypothetical protein
LARQVLDECLDYRTTSRPQSLEEVQTMCASFREAAQRWSAVRIGDGLTVSWRTVLRGSDRRFAPRRHARHR